MENPRYISTDLVRFGDENHLALKEILKFVIGFIREGQMKEIKRV